MEAFEIVGTQLHLIILPITAATLIAITIGALILAKRQPDMSDAEFWLGFTAMLTGIVGVVLGAVSLAMLVPFDGKYHQLYRVTTNVESVTNSFETGSGEFTSTPVMQLEGVDRPVTSSDPRVLTLEGKNVTFTCAIGWNYQAADTYSCSIYSINKEGAN